MQVGIAAGDAGRGRMRNGRRAAGADHTPLRAGQPGEALAGRIHQLVDLHVLLVGEALGRSHFRQLDRPADDRDGAAAVDQRPDAERFVDIRFTGRRGGGGNGAAIRGAQHIAGAEDAGYPEQLAATEHRSLLVLPQRTRRFNDQNTTLAPSCICRMFG